MKRLVLALTSLLLPLASSGGLMTALPRALCAETRWSVVDAFPSLDFEQPVDMRYAPGSPDRFFVVERAGRIVSFKNDSKTGEKSVFLDIRDRVRSRGQEEGLLGLVFHPKFAENGEFFVYYTPTEGPIKRLSRFHVDRNLKVNLDSEELLLSIPQPYSNHNGGSLMFGPDGYLYIGVGDGGSAGDPEHRGQNLNTLLGKLLRIDVNSRGPEKPYAIPADNPFVNQIGKRGEIYAYGLRNPWRFSFDAKTGELWLADVGQNRYEEIDLIRKGGNYGWNFYEGSHCFEPQNGCEGPGFSPPVFDYGRDEGISVTGGFVYRGKKLPELAGKYIYADFGSGRIWALESKAGKEPRNELLLKSDLNPASFAEDSEGELYVVALGGKMYRLTANR